MHIIGRERRPGPLFLFLAEVCSLKQIDNIIGKTIPVFASFFFTRSIRIFTAAYNCDTANNLERDYLVVWPTIMHATVQYASSELAPTIGHGISLYNGIYTRVM